MLPTGISRLWPFGMQHRVPQRGGTMPRPSNHTEPRGAAAIARHYLRDLVYGANDGIITTFAVVAGVTGGALTPTAVLVIGAANLAADGLSMGAGNFLAIRANESARQAENLPEEEADPFRHALATFVAFVLAGAVPLVPYLVPDMTGTRFIWSTVLTFASLFAVGAGRSAVTEDRWWATGLEMLVVGIAVAAAAFGAGAGGLRAHVRNEVDGGRLRNLSHVGQWVCVINCRHFQPALASSFSLEMYMAQSGRAVVVVVLTWLFTSASGSAQDAAKVARGQQVYVAQKCGICHSIAGKGNAKGPLDSVGATLSADEIRQWIVAAPQMQEKTRATRKPPMKAYELPKDDLDALTAYMQSLKK